VRRLLGSEFLRARSRRLVPMMVVGTLFGVLLGVAIGTVVADPKPSAEDVRVAKARYARDFDECLRGTPPPEPNAGPVHIKDLCRVAVQPDNYLSGLTFADLDSLLAGTASLVVLLGALLGSTLGGADWSAGTMTTLLTWEPRRVRVYVARALVIAVLALYCARRTSMVST